MSKTHFYPRNWSIKHKTPIYRGLKLLDGSF
jgi:hypothetical protein